MDEGTQQQLVSERSTDTYTFEERVYQAIIDTVNNTWHAKVLDVFGNNGKAYFVIQGDGCITFASVKYRVNKGDHKFPKEDATREEMEAVAIKWLAEDHDLPDESQVNFACISAVIANEHGMVLRLHTNILSKEEA